MDNFYENGLGYLGGAILATISITADLKESLEIFLLVLSTLGVLINTIHNIKKKFFK